MKLYLMYGHNSDSHGHYPSGVHDIDDADFASYLINTGHGTPMEMPPPEILDDLIDLAYEDVEDEAEEITMTEAAQKAMLTWGLTADDFEGETRITKPMVDAVIAQRVYDDEHEDDDED